MVVGGLWEGAVQASRQVTRGQDLPLVNVVCSEGVDPVNVRNVEDGLITGRVCGQFHQDFIQENGLKEGQNTGCETDQNPPPAYISGELCSEEPC